MDHVLADILDELTDEQDDDAVDEISGPPSDDNNAGGLMLTDDTADAGASEPVRIHMT
jgi:hypothetical protein